MATIKAANTTTEASTQRTELCHTDTLKERILEITMDSIGDGVISTDQKGHIIRINRVAQRLTGWSLDEAMGRNMWEVFTIIDSESGQSLKGPFEAALLSGVAVPLAPHTVLVARDGTRYMIEDSSAIIRDETTNTPYGIVLVFRDITEKNALEVEFQQAKKLETIGRLAGGIAHDFNNLLAGIIGYSETLLLELQTSPRLQGYARSILETSERAAKLTSQLLAFSRKGKRVSVRVDLHDRITSAVTLLKETSDRRIAIVTKLNATTSSVMGDPTLLESAILNLVINARDATPIGGAIAIESTLSFLEQNMISSQSLDITPGEYIVITISDSGTGMSDDVKSHLFEPFFTTKELGHGTGLGLAAVYGTAKEHQGAITVKSTLGEGTIITLYFPLCAQLTSNVDHIENPICVGHGLILVVDDEKIVRETASVMLEGIGYEVLLAETGVEALEIYRREGHRIDLVILDVVMPRLSGPDTFLALKNLNKEIRVIFSSGYTFENGAHELLINGAFGFIQKPFRRNTLYQGIQKSLQGYQRFDEVAIQ